jgi:putative NIF3 family GTP cyclohydrolase 1 type 2
MTLSNPIQASLLRCAAAGISVYSPHSALDSVYGGINDWLASGLGSGRVALIGDEHPGGGGPGRILKLDEKTTLSSLQERVKKHLGLTQSLCSTLSLSPDFIELRRLRGPHTVQVALAIDNPIKEVQSVAICAGSGGSLLLGVDADVYFTGEMSHVRLPDDHEVLGSNLYMYA